MNASSRLSAFVRWSNGDAHRVQDMTARNNEARVWRLGRDERMRERLPVRLLVCPISCYVRRHAAHALQRIEESLPTVLEHHLL